MKDVAFCHILVALRSGSLIFVGIFVEFGDCRRPARFSEGMKGYCGSKVKPTMIT